jgi:hypothetical protein
MQPSWKIVQLQREFAHPIHVFPPLGVFVLLKDKLLTLLIDLSFVIVEGDVNFRIPVSMDFVKHLFLFRIGVLTVYFTFDFKHISGGPPPFSVSE